MNLRNAYIRKMNFQIFKKNPSATQIVKIAFFKFAIHISYLGHIIKLPFWSILLPFFWVSSHGTK